MVETVLVLALCICVKQSSASGDFITSEVSDEILNKTNFIDFKNKLSHKFRINYGFETNLIIICHTFSL